jgi:ribosomal protein S18 acetylase RimI-like enzyme
MLDLLRRLETGAHQAAAHGREAVPVGPFTALFDRTSDFIWLSQAVPSAPLPDRAATLAALADLRRLFAARGRTLRFELIEALWPALPALLEEAGLQFQGRQPLMCCAPADLRPTHAPGVQVQPLAATADPEARVAYHRIARACFDMDPGTTLEQDAAHLREQLRTGQLRCALALLDGEPVGVGAIVPAGPVCELAGIGTLPAHRRRGVAATVSSALLADHFARGGTLAWLSVEEDAAAAVYARVGFRPLPTVQLNYSVPQP